MVEQLAVKHKFLAQVDKYIMPDKRTYQDRAEYLKAAVSKRRKQNKARAIQMKGGSCILCGYNTCKAALEFHHVDETTKDFGLSLDKLSRSWKRIEKELSKCVLVCSNCHKEIHAGVVQPPLGN